MRRSVCSLPSPLPRPRLCCLLGRHELHLCRRLHGPGALMTVTKVLHCRHFRSCLLAVILINDRPQEGYESAVTYALAEEPWLQRGHRSSGCAPPRIVDRPGAKRLGSEHSAALHHRRTSCCRPLLSLYYTTSEAIIAAPAIPQPPSATSDRTSSDALTASRRARRRAVRLPTPGTRAADVQLFRRHGPGPADAA